jgi:SAM-dependent methyltransferase
VPTPPFRPDRLASIAAAEDVHPWFVARRELVAGLVGRHRPSGSARIVDVGCGTGRTLTAVTRPGDEATGLDLLAGQAHAAGGRDDLVAADVRDLPLPADTADVVLALDVLEHVEEDDLAARELARVAAPGGIVIVTVPAHPWLWSYRDDDAGHVRRYTRTGLVTLLTGAGLRPRQVAWFAGATLPPLALVRFVARSSRRARDLEEAPGGGPVGRLVGRVLRAEARAVVAGGGPPLGSTLVAVAAA